MRLFSLLYSIAATVLSGVALIGVMVAGLPGWAPIALALAGGAIISLPATWGAARRIGRL